MVNWNHRCGLFAVALAAAVALGAATTRPAAKKAFEEVVDPRLHNAHRVTAKVLSGAEPGDEPAFAALRELGVKTIVSVDGAKPDVELARRYGMRYVHLPIGYGGVEAGRAEELAKAMAELPGPVYVHCHHGKHRSAAAVAVACVVNGSLRPEQAEDVLRTFGTGENYLGLWRDARAARPMDPAALAAKRVDYVEAATVTELAEAMVAVDAHWDHLKLLRKAGWRPVASLPDLSARHEALQLFEHYVEIGRGEDARRRDDRYRAILKDGEDGARALHGALSKHPADPSAAEAAFKRVAASCAACHTSFRD